MILHFLYASSSRTTQTKLDFKFIYNPKYTCANERAPFLMIIIKSKLNHFANRKVLRQTWAQHDDHGLIRRVFSLGIPKPSNKSNKYINEKLESENAMFGDLVQQNFYDDYYNNTLKTMMSMQWAIEYCSKVFYDLLFHSKIIYI